MQRLVMLEIGSYNYRKAMQDAGYKDGDDLGGKMFPTLYESI